MSLKYCCQRLRAHEISKKPAAVAPGVFVKESE